MQHPVEAPSAAALADLVERCSQIDRYTAQMTVAEESRISALAAGIVAMAGVLGLEPVPTEKLPARQARSTHWLLAGPAVAEARTAAIDKLAGSLALDDHGQVKVLTSRSWRGEWRSVQLWRDGVAGLRSVALMEYLARLAELAHERAPGAARALQERRRALANTDALLTPGPRQGPG